MKVWLLQQLEDYGDREWSIKTLGIFKDELFFDIFLKDLLNQYFRFESKKEENKITYNLFQENGWGYEHWFEITEMELI